MYPFQRVRKPNGFQKITQQGDYIPYKGIKQAVESYRRTEGPYTRTETLISRILSFLPCQSFAASPPSSCQPSLPLSCLSLLSQVPPKRCDHGKNSQQDTHSFAFCTSIHCCSKNRHSGDVIAAQDLLNHTKPIHPHCRG